MSDSYFCFWSPIWVGEDTMELDTLLGQLREVESRQKQGTTIDERPLGIEVSRSLLGVEDVNPTENTCTVYNLFSSVFTLNAGGSTSQLHLRRYQCVAIVDAEIRDGPYLRWCDAPLTEHQIQGRVHGLDVYSGKTVQFGCGNQREDIKFIDVAVLDLDTPHHHGEALSIRVQLNGQPFTVYQFPVGKEPYVNVFLADGSAPPRPLNPGEQDYLFDEAANLIGWADEALNRGSPQPQRGGPRT